MQTVVTRTAARLSVHHAGHLSRCPSRPYCSGALGLDRRNYRATGHSDYLSVHRGHRRGYLVYRDHTVRHRGYAQIRNA